MRLTAVIITLILCVQNAIADTYGTHWVSYPEPDSTSQIWFRQTYLTKACPEQASITVVSTGNFELFVNEYNVSTDVMMPYRQEKSDNPIAITYDVTRFLRSDSNTISVWYAPSYPHIDQKQISVSYYGRMEDDGYFSLSSDENWICHKADRALTGDGGERMDGGMYPLKWNANDIDAACWLPANKVGTDKWEATSDLVSFYDAEKVTKTLQPKNIEEDGDSVVCDFGLGFRGWIRITLRNAKAGETINIGGLEYVCNGKTDEQAYGKLTTKEYRELVIHGDNDFDIKQIQKIEGMEITPYHHKSYLY